MYLYIYILCIYIIYTYIHTHVNTHTLSYIYIYNQDVINVILFFFPKSHVPMENPMSTFGISSFSWLKWRFWGIAHCQHPILGHAMRTTWAVIFCLRRKNIEEPQGIPMIDSDRWIDIYVCIYLSIYIYTQLQSPNSFLTAREIVPGRLQPRPLRLKRKHKGRWKFVYTFLWCNKPKAASNS